MDAPSEGEAQGSYMVKKGDFNGIISQDTDCLLFGCPCMIKNLSISHRKKKVGKNSYETTKPLLLDLQTNLDSLNITLDQLIVIAILCGTDFNNNGVKGIGPKKALKLVKQYEHNFELLFNSVDWEFDYSWRTVYDTIKNIPVTDEYVVEYKQLNEKKIKKLMIEKHGFSEDRIVNSLNILKKKTSQKNIGSFF